MINVINKIIKIKTIIISNNYCLIGGKIRMNFS
jgi:hypothetical protein